MPHPDTGTGNHVPNGSTHGARVPRERVDINQNDNHAIREIIHHFRKENVHLTHMLKECREQFEALELNKQSIDAEITCVRQDMNKHLDNLESKLRSQLDEIHKEATKECQNWIYQLERRQSTLFEYQRRLDHVCRFWPQRRDSDVADIQTYYTNLIQNQEDTIRSYEYDFRINEKIDTLKERVRYLGDVKLLTYAGHFNDSGLPESEISQLNVDLRDCVASVSRGFAICEDQSSAIGGCVCLHNGLIMIGNRVRNSLQKYNSNGRLIAEKTLSVKPWDVCMVNPAQVAVSLPSSKTQGKTGGFMSAIEIIDTTEMKTVKEVTLPTKSIHGISFIEDKFAVACGPELQIVNMRGDVVHVIRVREGCIRYVCTTPRGNILFSDWNHNTVQCIGRDGMDIFTYAHPLLKGPVGLTVDGEENVYVAGFISNNIHQITPNGELCKILLNKDDGMRDPKTVFFQRYTNRFVLCDSRKVKMCHLKPTQVH
ncbi:hypothetical protein FSP39_017094 [Pinctada imbricata]|uniref:Uncharacterized protein n=1 Tax=Pinctada imbricata TaxID=66713 RepID=A0AA88YGJ3_PINIB|nr:hypothetical protein FSP39_017094 [Pinctada imbricata]